MDEFENGDLISNGIARNKIKRSKTGKSKGCIEWYWILSIDGFIASENYIMTTCDSSNDCLDYRTKGCGGSDGSGSGASSSFGPTPPANPVANDVWEYFDEDGKFIRKIRNASNTAWVVALNALNNVVIMNNYVKYNFLVFEWPKNDQIVNYESMLYIYNAASATWVGVPATDEAIADAIEDNIDDTKLDPCTKGIVDKLKLLTQSDISAMIGRFSPPGSLFSINMSVGKVNNSNDQAQTTRAGTSNFDVNMILNEDYVNGVGNSARPTDLSIATSITHEIIHAFLISLVGENQACGAGTICDFPTIYDAYVATQINNDPYILPDAHHELIATNYVNMIASTIQEFHTGIPVELGKATEVYTDLAWSGLFGTTYFNTKYPDNPNNANFAERVRIINRFYVEKNVELRGNLAPVGIPCN